MQIGEEKIPKLLLKFSIPAITGMLVQALYIVIDRIFVSYGVGTMAFASLTVIMPISFIIMGFGMLAGLGAAALISIRLGEGRTEEAENVLGNAFILLLIISAILTSVGLIFVEPILKLFRATPDILPYAKTYLSIILIGVPFQTVSFGMNHMLRASGKPRIAMLTMLMGALLNVIFDALFILAFKWGIAGAAWATIASQFVSLSWVMSCYLGKRSTLKLRKKYFILKKAIVTKVFSIGMSSFVTQIAAGIVGIVANTQLYAYGGDIAFASMGIISSIVTVFMMPVFGINQGSQPIIGYNYGAKKYDRVKETVRYGIIASTILCITGWLLIMLFPKFLIGLFTPDMELADATVSALRTFLFCLPIVGMQPIVMVFFQAIGQAGKALILSLLRQVLFLIPMYLILPIFFQLQGVWFSGPVADFMGFVVTLSVFIISIKKMGNIKAPNSNERMY